MRRHRLSRVVEAHLRLYSERAIERVRATGAVLAYVVDSEAGQAIAAQSVGTRVPHVKDVRDAAAQH